MMGFDELKRMAGEGLREAGSYPAEVRLQADRYDLTRFAEGQVHQNISMDSVHVTAAVYDGTRKGEVSLSAPNAERVKEAVRRAVEKLQYAAPGPERPMPGAERGYVAGTDPIGFDGEVSSRGTAWRTGAARAAIDTIEGHGPRAFGRAVTEVNERFVMNSEGLVSYTPRTGCDLNLTAIREGGYAASERHGFRLGDIDIEATALEAAQRCNDARNPRPLPAGEYPVILLPYATADMVAFLARLGADGEAIREGRSFMSGRIGEKVVSDKLNLWDDGFDTGGCPLPFDGEGVKKKRVELISDGVALGGVYNQASGAAEDRPSTGHAPVSRSSGGFWGGTSAVAQNLFLAPGPDTVEQMIGGTEYGLLISSFHYTRVVEPRSVVITGMTRNGTFLVEHGEVVGPVRNLRFTDSYIRALNQVTHLGSETINCSEGVGGLVVPALRLESLRFTSTTDF